MEEVWMCSEWMHLYVKDNMWTATSGQCDFDTMVWVHETFPGLTTIKDVYGKF